MGFCRGTFRRPWNCRWTALDTGRYSMEGKAHGLTTGRILPTASRPRN